MAPFAVPYSRPSSRISRSQAFTEQGVLLKYPSRSWSGVRTDDGAVVIAIREDEVQSSLDGFQCLLWSPVIEGATEWVDRPIKQERLQHCRLALMHGGADGLLVGGTAAEVDRNRVLTLRVEKRGVEYWALWGSVACAPGLAWQAKGPVARASAVPSRLAA